MGRGGVVDDRRVAGERRDGSGRVVGPVGVQVVGDHVGERDELDGVGLAQMVGRL
jgi:hypothetical protein